MYFFPKTADENGDMVSVLDGRSGDGPLGLVGLPGSGHVSQGHPGMGCGHCFESQPRSGPMLY